MAYMDILPFYTQVSMGYVEYADTLFKFGRNPSVGLASYEDIWYGGGTEVLLSSAQTMNVVSTSVNDTAAGTGMRTLKIHGLDNNYSIIKETVTLNGTTPVITTKSFLRVYRAYGVMGGNAGTNIGTITVKASITGSEHASVEPGSNQTQKTQFTIPASFYGFLVNINIQSLKGDQHSLDFRVKPFGELERTVFSVQGVETSMCINYPIPIIIAPKTDIKARAISTGAGTASISVSYQLLFINAGMVNIKNYRF